MEPLFGRVALRMRGNKGLLARAINVWNVLAEFSTKYSVCPMNILRGATDAGRLSARSNMNRSTELGESLPSSAAGVHKSSQTGATFS
jgi:hypothetical protein